MTSNFQEITSALTLYFDGLYHSDVELLGQIFHPRAIYVCATEAASPLTYKTMDAYFPLVAARPSPASRGEVRTDRIVSVELAGPVTAQVVVNCSIGARYFTDFLSLIKTDGRWQIISKVFHYETDE